MHSESFLDREYRRRAFKCPSQLEVFLTQVAHYVVAVRKSEEQVLLGLKSRKCEVRRVFGIPFVVHDNQIVQTGQVRHTVDYELACIEQSGAWVVVNGQ